MKVLNKTNNELEIRMTDRYQNNYKIYIPAGRSTELEPGQVSNDVINFLRLGYLEDITVNHKPFEAPVAVLNVPEDVTVVESCEEVVQDEILEDLVDVKDPEPSVFVCEVCGSEFASKRGLTMHMNKVHPEVSQ